MNSKEKGKRGELEVAKELRLLGFNTRRSAQYCGQTGDAPDVVGVDGLHLEVKRSEKTKMVDWSKQAERDCKGKTPVVVWRTSREPWRVTLRAEDFFLLYRELLERRNDDSGQGTDNP